MSAPNIMVSSTFYDLRQVRDNLRSFIEDDLGYNAVLSEFPSFPIDPNLNTIENCRSRVKEDADILILVVGGRYGYIEAESDKSITNLEYQEARNKGTPVFAFVEKGVHALLGTWKDNKDGDFSRAVESTRVFEFIDKIMNQDQIWVTQFETAENIIDVLRPQLANLFLKSLDTHQKVFSIGTPDWHLGLSPMGIKLVLEQNDNWENLLFFQVWNDEIQLRSNLLREYESGMQIRISEQVPVEQGVTWMRAKLNSIGGLTSSISKLVNIQYPEALKEYGVESDAKHLVWTAQYLGRSFERLLEWSLELRCASVDEPFCDVVKELEQFSSEAVKVMISFPLKAISELQHAIENPDGENVLNLTMTLDICDTAPFDNALAIAEKKFSTGEY